VFEKMKIFNTIFFAILCALPATVHATEECPYFSPALALCSVHAYNVGDAQNPTDVGRATEMEKIIGLKTTVMVQQLKQQYDELNAVIKRFKTQLNKAVLTSKIEVLTGNTSSSTGSSSGGSTYSATVLAGAEDCGMLDQAEVYNCLIRNLTKINQAAEKDITNARKQLEKDLSIATGYEMCGKNTTTDVVTDCKTVATECQNLGTKRNIQACTQSLGYKINMAKNNFENNRNQYRRGW